MADCWCLDNIEPKGGTPCAKDRTAERRFATTCSPFLRVSSMRSIELARRRRRCKAKPLSRSEGTVPPSCAPLDQDFPNAQRYIDFFHVVEKLAAAVGAYANHRPLRRTKDEIVADWRFRLLNHDGAIDEIEAIIKRWDAAHIEVGDRRPVHEALTYIGNHREQMNYAAARRLGHPIGSGHVEACCKQLVASRMKRGGQRWKVDGGQAVLTLRSLATDARWEQAMNVLMPTFKRPVESEDQAA